jgi:hypothetical protein
VGLEAAVFFFLVSLLTHKLFRNRSKVLSILNVSGSSGNRKHSRRVLTFSRAIIGDDKLLFEKLIITSLVENFTTL